MAIEEVMVARVAVDVPSESAIKASTNIAKEGTTFVALAQSPLPTGNVNPHHFVYLL